MFVSFGGFPIDNLSEFWYTFIQSSRKEKIEMNTNYDTVSKVGSVAVSSFAQAKQHAESSYWVAPITASPKVTAAFEKKYRVADVSQSGMVHYTTK